MSKYDLDLNGDYFLLVSKQTPFIASDSCGTPQNKLKVSFSEMTNQNSCKPGGGCC
jgi:hypothetical protein